MEYLLILLGVIIDRVFDLGFNRIKEWGDKSLLRDLRIVKCEEPFTNDGVTYWTIYLIIGKGNYLARLLSRNRTKLKLIANVRFVSFEKDNFRADAYEVNKGWQRRRVAFPIKPNSQIKLAVARRIKNEEGYYLYPIGGAFANAPLTHTYDLVVQLELDDEEKPISLESNTITEYIKKGNPI